ncbi:MAG: hypothetical protein Q3979_01395 [Actinomycetaceae bacterium]|nr:hypothetical protein [Actinomycetaceae bacterium]
MKRKSLFIVALAAAVVVSLVVLRVTVFRERAQCPGWEVVYDGYGEVQCGSGTVDITTKSAAKPSITHGGLVVAQEEGEGRVSAKMTTLDQVRKGQPNPWEVAWFLWRYQDPEHFYAIVLKPNGWEVSKQDPDYKGNQRFLDSGDSPTFEVGKTYEVEVTPVGEATFVIKVDGQEITTVTDRESPYLKGKVGLYTEDASVRFSDVDKGDPPGK